ncbi:MAG: TatD family hydrolase [Planctomycetota bacterium]
MASAKAAINAGATDPTAAISLYYMHQQLASDPMQRIFEPHIHMFSRVTEDYEALVQNGIRAVLEPAFWLGQSRTNVGSFIDYFDTLIGWERFRSEQFGIHHFCTMGLNPREANDDRLNRDVMDILPRYVEKDSVVAVGEIGLDDQTKTEEKFFLEQIQLAIEHKLPILIHTPHRDKLQGFRRCIDIVKESGIPMEHVLLDHGNEETIKITRELGCWSGFSIYPNTKMDEDRMVKIILEFGVDHMIINSAADWGVSDPLMVPKTVTKAKAAGVSDADIDLLAWQNPTGFFAQSGRLDPSSIEELIAPDRRETFTGNSVLRGQDPDKM